MHWKKRLSCRFRLFFEQPRLAWRNCFLVRGVGVGVGVEEENIRFSLGLVVWFGLFWFVLVWFGLAVLRIELKCFRSFTWVCPVGGMLYLFKIRSG